MKRTSALRTLCRPGLGADQLSIHPNDGFDLGMMTTVYAVEIEGAGPAHVKLVNECPRDCMELSQRLYEKFGKPSHAVLRYDGNRLYIEPC
ncbi:MAG TPA: hypothetical protein VMV44_15025 [Rectinemataceae bacterium]|nr:hypothetical protein [Rectinemataceae bacterium]